MTRGILDTVGFALNMQNMVNGQIGQIGQLGHDKTALTFGGGYSHQPKSTNNGHGQSQLSQSLNNLKQQLKFFASFSFERSLVCTKMADLLDNYGYFLEWMDDDDSAARDLINQCLTKKFITNSYGNMDTPEQLAKISNDNF